MSIKETKKRDYSVAVWGISSLILKTTIFFKSSQHLSFVVKDLLINTFYYLTEKNELKEEHVYIYYNVRSLELFHEYGQRYRQL